MGHKSQHNRVAVEFPEGPEGRQVCTKTVAGLREYRKRIEFMWERQDGLCALCGKPCRIAEATFDHEFGRGMGGGKRDDRLILDGRPLNAAVHFWCNAEKGSKQVPYLIQPRVDSGLHLEEMLEGD
jgi:hypothetical protein